MKTLPKIALQSLLIPAALALVAADCAKAAPRTAGDVCQLYGYVPHTRAYAACRMNVRYYWSTGPCSDSRFAAVHVHYCHVVPELDY